MKWERDTLVDQLIAKNVARPRPGMDKPDAAMMRLPGKGQKMAATASIQAEESAQTSAPVPGTPSKRDTLTDSVR